MGSGPMSRRQFLGRSAGLGLGLGMGGLVAASCGGGGGGASDGSEVQFFARGDQAIWKVFRQLRDEFRKANPDIDVKVEEVPGDYYQKFQLKLASGTPPDCLFECDCSITSSIRAGALEPLDELMKGDSRFQKADFLPMSWYTSQDQGKTYGLPYDGGSMVLYYNLDLLEEANLDPPDPKEPMSWEQLVEYGQALTIDRNGKRPTDAGFDPKRIKQYGFEPNSTWIPWLWVWGSGGEVITADGKVPLDEPEAVKGLQFLADMGIKNHIAPSPAFQQSGQLSFLTGNVAMAYDGVWSSVRYRESKFDWDIAPFPLGDVPVSTGWYSPLAITSQAAAQESAWKWISFCTSTEGQRIVAGLGQAVPAVRELAQSDVFLDPSTKPKNKQVFLEQLSDDLLRTPGDRMGRYFGGYVVEFRDIFDPLWDSVLSGKRPAADVMKEARPKLEHLLKTGKPS